MHINEVGISEIPHSQTKENAQRIITLSVNFILSLIQLKPPIVL